MRAAVRMMCVALISSGSAAMAQEAGDAEAGHTFAQSLCAICHAVEDNQADSPNSSAPTFRRIAAEPGMTATALSVILTNPHRDMPDLVLSPEDRTNVIAYILTLKPNE